MTAYDFIITYATLIQNQKGERFMLNPLHNGSTGSWLSVNPDGSPGIGGEYELIEKDGGLFFSWGGIEYLVSPSEKGFDLLRSESVKHSFTRVL